MKITPALARFIEGPVLMTLATRDAANRPVIGRGSGARATEERKQVEIAVSAHLWPETVANVADNGMLAATFVQPTDYVAFQLKGRASLRPPEKDDIARARTYVEETEKLLADQGVPLDLIRYWLTAREIMLVCLSVDRAFEQTPGPRAGVSLL